MRKEIESLKTEVMTKVSALKERLIRVINDLPDSTKGVRMLSKNCCTVPFSMIRDNSFRLSPSYWMTLELKTNLIKIVESSGIEALSKHIEEILQTGEVKARNGSTIPIHPEIIQKLKEAWEA